MDSAWVSHIPTSPRNQLMFFKCHAESYPTRFSESVVHIHLLDVGDVEVVESGREDILQVPARKRRRYAARILSTTPQEFVEELGIAGNKAVADRGIYKDFCEELMCKGLIQLRQHSSQGNVVAMSSYSYTTGRMQPLEFVHTTSSYDDDNKLLLTCTCAMYKQIQGVALKKVTDQDENSVLDDKFTCMHCRFYRESLHPVEEDILQFNRGSNLVRKVQENLGSLNNPVVLLGQANSKVTTKLSVLGESSCALIHVNFTAAGNCFARCQQGLCQAYFLHRSRMPKVVAMDKIQGDLCPHMKSLFANLEVLHKMFPKHFSEDVTDEDLEIPRGPEVGEDSEVDVQALPFPEVQVPTVDQLSFNEESGMWESGSYSQHKPRERDDPQIVTDAFHRLGYIRGEPTKGCFLGPDLIPKHQNPDGSTKKCPHGSVFCNEELPDGLPPILHHQTKLYTRQVY